MASILALSLLAAPVFPLKRGIISFPKLTRKKEESAIRSRTLQNKYPACRQTLIGTSEMLYITHKFRILSGSSPILILMITLLLVSGVGCRQRDAVSTPAPTSSTLQSHYDPELSPPQYINGKAITVADVIQELKNANSKRGPMDAELNAVACNNLAVAYMKTAICYYGMSPEERATISGMDAKLNSRLPQSVLEQRQQLLGFAQQNLNLIISDPKADPTVYAAAVHNSNMCNEIRMRLSGNQFTGITLKTLDEQREVQDEQIRSIARLVAVHVRPIHPETEPEVVVEDFKRHLARFHVQPQDPFVSNNMAASLLLAVLRFQALSDTQWNEIITATGIKPGIDTHKQRLELCKLASAELKALREAEQQLPQLRDSIRVARERNSLVCADLMKERKPSKDLYALIPELKE